MEQSIILSLSKPETQLSVPWRYLVVSARPVSQCGCSGCVWSWPWPTAAPVITQRAAGRSCTDGTARLNKMWAWLVGCYLWLATTVRAELSCASPVVVTVVTHLNATGQWGAKVELEHSKLSGPWEVRTDLCQVGQTVRVTAVLTRGGDRDAGLGCASCGGAGAEQPLPEGYVRFPGIGAFRFHPEAATWPEARLACQEEGAELAVLNSEREADLMALLFARFPPNAIKGAATTDWAWVGVHEMGVDGEYFTVRGESLNSTGFTRWVPGQPDDKKVDTAVVINRGSGGLGDAYPSWQAPFICEI